MRTNISLNAKLVLETKVRPYVRSYIPQRPIYVKSYIIQRPTGVKCNKPQMPTHVRTYILQMPQILDPK